MTIKVAKIIVVVLLINTLILWYVAIEKLNSFDDHATRSTIVNVLHVLGLDVHRKTDGDDSGNTEQ